MTRLPSLSSPIESAQMLVFSSSPYTIASMLSSSARVTIELAPGRIAGDAAAAQVFSRGEAADRLRKFPAGLFGGPSGAAFQPGIPPHADLKVKGISALT